MYLPERINFSEEFTMDLALKNVLLVLYWVAEICHKLTLTLDNGNGWTNVSD